MDLKIVKSLELYWRQRWAMHKESWKSRSKAVWKTL